MRKIYKIIAVIGAVHPKPTGKRFNSPLLMGNYEALFNKQKVLAVSAEDACARFVMCCAKEKNNNDAVVNFHSHSHASSDLRHVPLKLAAHFFPLVAPVLLQFRLDESLRTVSFLYSWGSNAEHQVIHFKPTLGCLFHDEKKSGYSWRVCYRFHTGYVNFVRKLPLWRSSKHMAAGGLLLQFDIL